MTTEAASIIPGKEIYPVAYGHEHETGHMVRINDGEPSERDAFAKLCPFYIPEDYPKASSSVSFSTGAFLANGFKVYRGGDAIVEIATPECSNPLELVAYQKAGRRMFGLMFEKYLNEISSQLPEDSVKGSIHDRVVDVHGSRKGSHLNIGLNDVDRHPIDSQAFLQYMASRSFVIGAGYVREDGYRYAQKIGGLVEINSYGNHGSMYRTSPHEGTFRIEDRCGDINLSDWAAWQRAGGMALAIAVARTPLAEELPDINPHDISEHLLAKQLNICPVTSRGDFKGTDQDLLAVNFQQKVAELAMDKLRFYSDELPQELFDVAKALYDYCDDFRKLLSGTISIHELEAEADWLVKLQLVTRNMNNDQSFNIKRNLGDTPTRARDLTYDLRTYTAVDGEITHRTQSIADKLFRKGILKTLVNEQAIARALVHAPTGTRASLREELIRNYTITEIDWHGINIKDDNRGHSIWIPDVTQTTFDGESLEMIGEIKQKR